MTPLFDKILIDIYKAETTTKSGIILTTENDKKVEKAKVLKVGPDCVSQLKKGDTILFKGYSADTVAVDDKEYSFIKEEDVLAIV